MSEPSLTTLQLTEKIARAVLNDTGEHGEARAAAVLNVLRETSHWFCRLEDVDGRTTQMLLDLPPV